MYRGGKLKIIQYLATLYLEKGQEKKNLQNNLISDYLPIS